MSCLGLCSFVDCKQASVESGGKSSRVMHGKPKAAYLKEESVALQCRIHRIGRYRGIRLYGRTVGRGCPCLFRVKRAVPADWPERQEYPRDRTRRLDKIA